MGDITERQEKILLAVIREFMREADAVGSMNVIARHHLGVSSATVRNDMVVLSEMGFLTKDHSSSGRTPTDLAFKYFVDELMPEMFIPNIDEVNARLSIFRKRFDEDDFVDEIIGFLSDETGYASVSQLDDDLRYKGLSQLTKYRELRNIDVLEGILSLLEDRRMMNKLFRRSTTDDVCVLIGRECGYSPLRECSLAFTRFGYIGDRKGYVGVLGPRRMRYSKVIPAVRFVKNVVEEAVRGW